MNVKNGGHCCSSFFCVSIYRKDVIINKIESIVNEVIDEVFGANQNVDGFHGTRYDDWQDV
ncbi:MAG: hypothetical protein U5L95_02655 [Candidatus Saccharibacteria bacterium]|nr:hypothetical protein [Candidatus Saccharibacteria bacterium]